MTDLSRDISPAMPAPPSFLPRPGSLAYRRLSLAAVFAIPLFFFTISFNVVRLFSDLPLLAALALGGGVCLVARRLEISRSYLVFGAYATAILGTSLMGWMPDGWTNHFDRVAAVRHWLWIPALPILTTAFIILFGRLQSFILRRALLIALAIFAYVQLMSIAFDLDYDFALYEIDNHKIPVSIAIILFLFRQRRNLRVDIALILGYILLSTSSSQQLLGFAILAVRLSPRAHWAVIGVGLTVMAMLILAPIFAEVLDRYDENAGVRAIMWRDAIDATAQTNGLGVGFGTEYIRNQFYAIRSGDWQVADPLHPGFLFLSTHSTFYDTLLRVGVLGLALSAIWLVATALPKRRMSRQNRKAHAALACAVIIFSAFNPALISFNSLFGMAAILAWMHLLTNQPGLLTHRPRRAR